MRNGAKKYPFLRLDLIKSIFSSILKNRAACRVGSAVFLFFILISSGCSFSNPKFYSMSDPAAAGELVAKTAGARVIFIGEFHDNRLHHDIQMKVIKLLKERGDKLLIGLEMFDIESQRMLDHWVSGRLSLEQFTKIYQQNWTIQWSEYGSILLFARNEKIPLIGLNAPLDLVMRVSRNGWKSLSEGDKARLPVGISTETTSEYRNFIYSSFSNHSMTHERFQNFADAQGLRNSTMALAILENLKNHPDHKMIVITGMGHAVRSGITASLPADIRKTSIILFPYEEKMQESIDRNEADYYLIE